MSEIWVWWDHLLQGEKASWVQAWGSIAAIGVTAFLAGYAELSRRSKERRQAEIFYKIACDTFADVVSVVETGVTLSKDKGAREAVMYLRAASERRVPGNIAILQQVMMTPLPSSTAARDVQFARTFAYVIVDKLKEAHIWDGGMDAELIPIELNDILLAGRLQRDLPRTRRGPGKPRWWDPWDKPI